MQVVLGPLPYAVMSVALVYLFTFSLSAAGRESSLAVGFLIFPIAQFLSSALFALRKVVRPEWSSGPIVLLGCALVPLWQVVLAGVQIAAMTLLTGVGFPWGKLFPFPGWLISFAYQTAFAVLAGLLVLAVTRKRHSGEAPRTTSLPSR